MRLVRPALVALSIAGIAIASTASAGGPAAPNALTYSDPAGDHVPTAGGNDILSVTYTTSGTIGPKGNGKGGGKGNQAYTPKALVVTMKLAGPPSDVPGTLYEVDAVTSGCGDLLLYFTPGVDGSGGLVDCGSAPDELGSTTTSLDVEPEVQGSTITWTLPFSMLPKEVSVGSRISEFVAYSTQTDPLTGVVGPYLFTSDLNYDNATSDATYKIG
ncbi:MAG: hypothetical protein JJD92_11330 [Frankiaceae bacterium]|nr:hypothetical protein [Frankiaceae bacterium]